jgi:L-ascorbate metabolism protein UlaG (beta-lactamase superfamily)
MRTTGRNRFLVVIAALGPQTFVVGFAMPVLLAVVGLVRAAEPSLGGDRIGTGEEALIVRPINHATLAFGWKQRVIYVDPVGGAARFAGLPKGDLVLLTDIHQDHLNVDSLRVVAKPDAKLVAPPAVAAQLPEDLRNRTTVVTNGQSANALEFRVEAVAAYNLSPERAKFHAKGRGNGYVVTLGGKRVYLSGDTEDTPEMRALSGIDVAFLCMNLPYTMDVDRAADAVRQFRPKIVYPYHCRGSDLEMFKKLVGDDVGVEVRLRDWYKP